MSNPEPKVGQPIHGFANGFFGRDSYQCRRIEAIGHDWLVTRDTRGVADLISRESYDRIDLDYYQRECDEEGCDL